MRVRYQSSFNRDIRRIRDIRLRREIERVIADLHEAASITDLSGVRKLRSASGRHYRIRIREYRLGIILYDDAIVLARFAHRSEFYRRFP